MIGVALAALLVVQVVAAAVLLAVLVLLWCRWLDRGDGHWTRGEPTSNVRVVEDAGAPSLLEWDER